MSTVVVSAACFARSLGPLLLTSLAIMGSPGQATISLVAKIAVLTVMFVVINATWLIGGKSRPPLLRDPRRARVVNAWLAVALIASTALAVVH